ncbi:MAG: cyclic nucleotide-binding domain-containing protein [Gallionellaceae bacterium]|nr:cyclic nucleotide-binding domain-containing protein [Gallionellaceae bacterium]
MNKFKGPEGRQRLVEELLKQSILRDDKEAATVIAEKCTLAEYSARSSIFREGDASHYMLLILGGRVSVVVHGHEVAQRVAGQHVGEMALIDPSAPRSASIVAIEDTMTASISEPDFTKLAEHDPKLWRLLALELAEVVRLQNEK